MTYQATTLTKLGLSMMPAPASKMDERESVMKSLDTSGSSQCALNSSADLLVGGALLQCAGQVHNRDVGGWHAEGHASQLALQLWDDAGHSLGCAS
eukprot:7232-Heterococcus_DN1.PRE.4